MGASLVYLNEPNTEIEHEVGSNDYLKFAAGSMQGWRLNMVSLSKITDFHKVFPLCNPSKMPPFVHLQI